MFKKVILILIVLLVIVGFAFKNKLMVYMHSNDLSVNKVNVELIIDSETTLTDLAERLVKLGVLDGKTGFLALGEHKQIDFSNIALGKYIL